MQFLARKRILLPAAARLLAFGLSLGLHAGAQTPQDEAKIKDLLSRLTVQEEIRMLSGSSLMSTTGIDRLRIPSFRMSDGPMGAHVPGPSTAYAAGIGLAATWDRELAQQIGSSVERGALVEI